MKCELSGFCSLGRAEFPFVLGLLFLPCLLVSCPLCPGLVPSLVSFPFLFPSFFLSFSPSVPFPLSLAALLSSFPAFLAFVFMFLFCSGHLKSYLSLSVRLPWKDHAPLEDLRARVHVEPHGLLYQFNILHWLCPQALHGIPLKEWVWQE